MRGRARPAGEGGQGREGQRVIGGRGSHAHRREEPFIMGLGVNAWASRRLKVCFCPVHSPTGLRHMPLCR